MRYSQLCVRYRIQLFFIILAPPVPRPAHLPCCFVLLSCSCFVLLYLSMCTVLSRYEPGFVSVSLSLSVCLSLTHTHALTHTHTHTRAHAHTSARASPPPPPPPPVAMRLLPERDTRESIVAFPDQLNMPVTCIIGTLVATMPAA